MTEKAIAALAAAMYEVVRHEDVDVDTEFERHGRKIVLTPFDGAYTMIGDRAVRAYDHDGSWMDVANRIRLAA